MFVDLRESTRLATGRLPYDALFLFDRYIQVVTGAVRKHSGHVTSVAGDGVIDVFGVHGNAASAARDAFRAAHDLWSGLGALNKELAAELGAPLRIGIGLHVGVSVVGLIATRRSQSLQFLGDTGNIAGKLEQQTKQPIAPWWRRWRRSTSFRPAPGSAARPFRFPARRSRLTW